MSSTSESAVTAIVDTGKLKVGLPSQEDLTWNPWFLDGGRQVLVEHIDFSESDLSSVSEGPPERDPQWKYTGDIHKEGDYWQIQKLMKFVKVGDQTTTAVALACLADFDYTNKANQIAFVDTGGLEILVNILETQDLRCQLGSLTIMSKISVSVHVQRFMHNLGAIPILLKLLCNPNSDLQRYSATTLMNVAKQRICRTVVRKKGGIPILMELVDKPEFLTLPFIRMTLDQQEAYSVTIACLSAISLLARSVSIRKILFVSGIVKLFPLLIKSHEYEANIDSLRIIMLCASVEGVRAAMEMHDHLKLLLKPLTSGDPLKEELVCRILFKCGQNKLARAQIGKMNLLKALIVLIKNPETEKHEKTLKYCAGAIWRASFDSDNLHIIDDGNIFPNLINLLSQKNIQVRTYVAGCLAELTEFPINCISLMKAGGLPKLVDQANKAWDTGLLENITKCLGNTAKNPECIPALDQLEALRIIWSLLKGKTIQLQINAGLAIVPMLKNMKNAGELVRSFVGGIELLIFKLSSPNVEVIAAACEALAEVMHDEENLTIVSELGIVEKLTELTPTSDDGLRESLAHAIASGSMSAKNASLFGKLGAISPMVGYLASTEFNVVVAAAYALWKLSMEPINCISLHCSGVVPFLVECVGSEDERLQEAAGGCLNNIRLLAYEADQRSHLMNNLIANVKRPKQLRAKYSAIVAASSVSQLSK